MLAELRGATGHGPKNKAFVDWINSPDAFLTAIEGNITVRDLMEGEPVSILNKLGCYVGDARRVQVLYRTRFVSDAKNGVFAYPIVIAADGPRALLN